MGKLKSVTLDYSKHKFRFIKILDIGYIVLLYFIFSLTIAIPFVLFAGIYDPENDKEKTLFRLSIEIILLIWGSAVVGYILRNIMELIPSPFDGIYGFKHSLVKENITISSYVITILLMTSIYNRKLEFFTKRLYRYIEKIKHKLS